MKIHLIVGARPNFMKIAPLYKEFEKYPEQFEIKLIHTGQHYDKEMSKLFFENLQMPKPNNYLGVGSGTHGEQTAKIMERYEEVLLQDKPNLVIVAGDVNSTIACALDAVKLHIKVAHLEAGLRSFDRKMPEEINRIITDQISDYLLTPSEDADENLLHEGIELNKIYFVGNIMIDSLKKYIKTADESKIHKKLKIGKSPYVLITLHRPSNVDNEENLHKIFRSFEKLSNSMKLVFPMHPRTRKRLKEFNLENKIKNNDNLIITKPLGYYDFLKLQKDANVVLTDSGGIQEETTYFGVPCLTLRENTERPITIKEGTNKLIKLEIMTIMDEVKSVIDKKIQKKIPKYWDGKTAERIVKIFRENPIE